MTCLLYRMQATSRELYSIVVMAVVVLVSGCGDVNPERVALHPVSGQILDGAQPAVGVQVVLYPQDAAQTNIHNLFPHGETDQNGRFDLSTYVAGDGAPTGDWTVTLTWPIDRIDPKLKEQWLATGDSLPDRLRGRYASPQASKLHVTITDEIATLDPIDLKSQ